MKNQMMLVAAIAAFAIAGCAKGASVESQGGGKLTLLKPGEVTLLRGGMAKADIKVRRQDFPGDVTIRFTNLPKGVDVVETDNKIVGDEGSYTLRAGETADLVESFSADVTASAGPGSVSVSEPISINVRQK